MEANQLSKGYISWEVFRNGEWVFEGEDHNVTNIQYRSGLASSLAGLGSQVIANKMSAGTDNTSFTADSLALGTEVGSTSSLTNSVSGVYVTQCVGTVFFSGSYTIQEVGLWFGAIPLAFGNINASVTYLSPLRINWSITHL